MGGNQVTDCHPVGGISCLRPAAAKLQLQVKKVQLSAHPLENSLLAQNRKRSASLTASLLVPAGYSQNARKVLQEKAKEIVP